MSAQRIARAIAVVAAALAVAPLSALPPLQGATHLSAGETVVCAALAAGGAACWGGDDSAALGRPTSGRAAGPVGDLDDALASIAVGGQHACATGSDGRLWCWGDNWSGQLGIGWSSSTRGPSLVNALAGVTHVSAGSAHSCAVAGGAAYCWGENYYGQIGDGTTTQRPGPVPVAGLGVGALGVAAGSGFSCAAVAGGAWCWGANGLGQLGDGTMQQQVLPAAVAGLSANVTSLAAGRNHACAIQSGAVKCWGANWSGQLGDGTTVTRSTPVNSIGATAGMVAVAAGSTHTCALRNDGVVLCWGDNMWGQLGDGTTDTRYAAGPVAGLAAAALGVAVSNNGTCALLANGAVQCFGGQVLGIGALDERVLPVEVGAVAGGIASLSAGGTHTCGTAGGGAAVCFGTGSSGQLGTGVLGVAPWPVIVPALSSGVADVSAGYSHTCARTQAGAAYCWGDGSGGKLGSGQQTPSYVPSPVVGLAGGVAGIAAGGSFSCAVDGAGAVKCWGDDSRGSLGDGGGAASSAVPVQVAGLVAGVARVAVGDGHACALRTGGGVKCWGRNEWGQIGDGTLLDRFAPVDVLGLAAGIVDIAAGRDHTCAVTATGGVLCWGANHGGQLGEGTFLERLAPVNVPGLPGAVVQVAAGYEHTCALTAGGDVHCWGSDDRGQTGPNGGVPGPVLVPLGTPALSITAGGSHTCAVVGSGRALCWGNSTQAQLGNGDVERSPVPRYVAVGDFHSAVALASSPNPSTHGEYVTIVARVTAADAVPEGSVSFTDAGSPLRCAGSSNAGVLVRGEASCVVPLLVGQHDLRASFDGSIARLLPSHGAVQHTVLAVAGQHCAGFDDVDAADPFCASVEWLRNREVTLGCRTFDYCPGVPVSRLAMAAFMDRLGGVLAPETLLVGSVPDWLYAGPLHCQLTVPAATHPRRAIVDVVVSATSDTLTEAVFETAYRAQVPPYADAAAGPAVRVAMSSAAPAAVRLHGAVDIDVEQTVLVGFRFEGQAAMSSLSAARCVVRAAIFNRDVAHAPFDVPSGGRP